MESSREDNLISGFLTGKVALVIGGGRGLGRATALKLASSGARVVVAARTALELEDVVAEIEADSGQAAAHILDVTKATEVEAFADEIRGIFGRVDVLVNCAGVAHVAPLEATSESDWDRVIDTNLKGTYLCTHALLDLLRASDGALVVNIASKVGLTGHAMVTAYTAAKAGVIGFSRADTPMRWEATPKLDPNLVISAETVAETILFLAKLNGHATMGEIVLEAVAYDESAVPLDQ